MKCEAMTEKEMRDTQDPWPQTSADLTEYIDSLINRSHDYGTSAYAMSLAAVAAFNYVAHVLGTTGFQASCADLDFIRRSRGIEGPFILLRGQDMLYPQYDLREKLDKAMDEWLPWAAAEAQKKLAETHHAHPDVLAHWERLARLRK